MLGDDDFSVNVSRWVERAKEQGRAAFVGIGFQALSRVKELTPVDTGWLRSNWQIQRDGEAAPATRAALPADPGKAAEMLKELKDEQALTSTPEGRQAAEGAAGAQLGEKLIVVNPVVYARAIEFGREIQKKDGTIVHAQGAGMVAQTVTEIPQIAEEVVRDMRMGGA